MEIEIVMYLDWKEVECKRLLEDICRKLEDGATSGSIFDINGNKVGQWSR